MTNEQLRKWRLAKGWSKRFAGMHIGVSNEQIALLEKGKRMINGREVRVRIPKPIAWACAAINSGLKPLGDE